MKTEIDTTANEVDSTSKVGFGLLRDAPGLALGVGLLIRLALAPYTSWSNDVAVWSQTTLAGFYGLHLYDRPGFSYPPLWGYFLEGLGLLERLAGQGPQAIATHNQGLMQASLLTGDLSTVVPNPIYNLMFKTLLFGSDLASAFLIYGLVRMVTRDDRRARLACVVWFLNPFVIYESAVQGAPDTIVGLTVLATLALILTGRPFWAGVAWTIGILVKLTPIALGLELLLVAIVGVSLAKGAQNSRLKGVALLIAGAAGSFVLLLMPEAFLGSLPNMLHNVLYREQSPVVVGGLSILGLRHFKLFAWLVQWGLSHSNSVIWGSLIAQGLATLAWSCWTAVSAIKNNVLAVFSGAVGILSCLMLLAPTSNPQYISWWLPTLIVVVVVTNNGWWELSAISTGALIFVFGVLGPLAFFAPLATYTHLLPTAALSESVIQWVEAPGRLWGVGRPDEFFAPAMLVITASLLSLFVSWFRNSMVSRPRRLTG